MRTVKNAASTNIATMFCCSVRSLGSLIQCLGAMTKWVQLDEFKEVEEICSNAVDAVIMNVSGGKVMKVRWYVVVKCARKYVCSYFLH